MRKEKTKKPKKQRKRKANLPLHRRQKKMSTLLKPNLREEYDKRNFPVREGDKVRVTRGTQEGRTGEVSKVNLQDYTVEIKDIERETEEGELVNIKFDPSNLMITKLNLEDEERKESINR